MRKRTIWVAMIGFVAVLGGCDSLGDILEVDPLYHVDAPFGLSTRSGDEIRLMVNNQEVGPAVTAAKSAAFKVNIPVALPRGGNQTVYDVETYVTVQIFNRRTSLPTPPISCRAGAKIITSVFHEVTGTPPYQYERVECRSSW